MIKHKNLSVNAQSIINLISQLLSIVIGLIISFVLSPIIVKDLGVEANGFTRLASDFIMFASLITLAINSMAGRFMLLKIKTGDIEGASKYYSSVVIANIIITMVLAIPAVALVWRLESLLAISTKNIKAVKILFSLSFGNYFIGQLFGALTNATYCCNKFYINNIVNIFMKLFSVIGIIVLFSFFAPQIYFSIAIDFVLGIAIIPINIIIKRKLLPNIKFAFKFFSIKFLWELLKSGVWNSLSQLGSVLLTSLDLLLANLLISPAKMGVLSIGKMIPNNVYYINAAVTSSFTPNIIGTYATEKENLINKLKLNMKITILIMAIIVPIFIVFSIDFYKVWMPTENSKELAIISTCAVIGFIVTGVTYTLNNIFGAYNKLMLNSIVNIVIGIINLGLVYILVKYTSLGIYAIACTSVILQMIKDLFIIQPYASKLLHIKWNYFYKFNLLEIFACFISGGIAVLVWWIMPNKGWLFLVINVVLSCILVVFPLFFIIFNKSERSKVVNKIKIKSRKNKAEDK